MSRLVEVTVELVDASAPECYVCAEEGSALEPLLQVCSCTDRFIHLSWYCLQARCIILDSYLDS